MRRTRLRLTGLAAIAETIVFLALLFVSPSRAADAEYRLGPQDKLRIKVYDWRSGMGEAHEWSALTGDFVIGASGDLSLPLLGDIPASGRTTSVVAKALVERLQAKVGLARLPDASVEVTEYRPFYIIGVVDKGGEYAYRPGLTVLQAVGIAGGLARTAESSLLGYERDALAGRGELRVLETERSGLLARQARLDAEISDAPAIVFKDETLVHKADPDTARMMREEQLLFANFRDAETLQVASLNQTREVLGHEVEMLAAKDVSLAHQSDLATKELDLVAGLVDKGLAVAPRKLALQQSAYQFQTSRLDVQLASMRAKQDTAKIDQTIIELQTKRRTEALIEASDVRAKLAALSERIATAQAMIYQAEVRAPEVTAQTEKQSSRPVRYSLTRTVGPIVKTDVVGEADLVQPGDTIRVERQPGPQVLSDGR